MLSRHYPHMCDIVIDTFVISFYQFASTRYTTKVYITVSGLTAAIIIFKLVGVLKHVKGWLYLPFNESTP